MFDGFDWWFIEKLNKILWLCACKKLKPYQQYKLNCFFQRTTVLQLVLAILCYSWKRQQKIL
jgi:hypothetical protein